MPFAVKPKEEVWLIPPADARASRMRSCWSPPSRWGWPHAILLPPLLHKNMGDILYATMLFWLLGWLRPQSAPMRLCVGALLACSAIEFAKLIHTPWLASLRHTQTGALALGTGFHISNLACYALGALLGLAIERLFLPGAPSAKTDAPI